MTVKVIGGWLEGWLPGPSGAVWIRQFRQTPYLDLRDATPNLVLHTTETQRIVRELQYPSQWQVGEGFIAQHKPLWSKGEALRGDLVNDPWAMQIEMVAYSKLDIWLPPKSTLEPLVALVAWLHREGHIKSGLKRPRDWPTKIDKLPAAVEGYYRRNAGAWPTDPGVYGHIEIPGNCVAADTPVLCADLTWRAAGDLLPGDELIALDAERPTTDSVGRRLRRAIVTGNAVRRDALLLVNTPAGSVRCNYEHPWLVDRRKRRTRWGSPAWEWVRADELEPGDEVMHLFEPWQAERSWEAGWLAGMYDGEGSLTAGPKGVGLSVAQRESDTADRLEAAVKERAYASVVKRSVGGLGQTPMMQIAVQSVGGAMRMLGMVRPPRLLAKADAVWEGRSVGRASTSVPVLSVESHGTGHIAALSTSTETYIAGGFAMHNTHWDPGSFDYPTFFGMVRRLLDQEEEDVRLDNYKDGADKALEKAKQVGGDPGPPPESMDDADRRDGWKHMRASLTWPKA